jgi:subfamily B ATP-binding cassette protein HlyB/CyaB
LSTYVNSGVVVLNFVFALGNLTKDLGLTSSGLVIEPVQKTSKSETSTSYVLRHFLIQKSTAKVIISISLVIALLGLATPLGFQTFTDKILPYSAQGSLLVVVALLLLAAIATSVFQCFRDY